MTPHSSPYPPLFKRKVRDSLRNDTYSVIGLLSRDRGLWQTALVTPDDPDARDIRLYKGDVLLDDYILSNPDIVPDIYFVTVFRWKEIFE